MRQLLCDTTRNCVTVFLNSILLEGGQEQGVTCVVRGPPRTGTDWVFLSLCRIWINFIMRFRHYSDTCHPLFSVLIDTIKYLFAWEQQLAALLLSGTRRILPTRLDKILRVFNCLRISGNLISERFTIRSTDWLTGISALSPRYI